MGKFIFVSLGLLAMVSTAWGQTSNENYDVRSFGEPPSNESNWGDTVSVAADGQGSILVLRRAEPPVLVFNREGELEHTWGDGLFPDIHSIDVDHQGFVWITDTTDHMVYKFTMTGERLLALGTKGVTGDNSSRTAFNRPTRRCCRSQRGYLRGRRLWEFSHRTFFKRWKVHQDHRRRPRAPSRGNSIHRTRSGSTPRAACSS